MSRWVQLDDAEREILRRAAASAEHVVSDQLMKKLEPIVVDEIDAKFIDAVRDVHGFDDIDYDDDPLVSSSEEGAYVMAWLWVSNSEAGIHPAECENCGCTDNDGSDVCPDCGGAIVDPVS